MKEWDVCKFWNAGNDKLSYKRSYYSQEQGMRKSEGTEWSSAASIQHLDFPLSLDCYKGILECLLVCSLPEEKYDVETEEEAEMDIIGTRTHTEVSKEQQQFLIIFLSPTSKYFLLICQDTAAKPHVQLNIPSL